MPEEAPMFDRDLISRAAWTFAQAFLAVLALGLADVTDIDGAKAAAVAAVAAGLSAVKTVLIGGTDADEDDA